MTDNQQPSVEIQRTCRACGHEKPYEEFAIVYAKNSRGQNYRQHTCKACAKTEHAARMRKARADNPGKYQAHQREHRQRHLERVRRQRRESGKRRKDAAFNAYGGYRCCCCGETEESMLNIDHVNNDGAAHRRAITGQRGRMASVDFYSWLKAHGYPAGFQVLCYNCNLSKHRNGGVCAHEIRRRSNDYPEME